jgi:hypothetical protein
MAREKITITIDRSKAERARSLTGAPSTSQVIDVALERLIRAERLRRDIAAYRRVPPTESEVELALLAETGDLDDQTDWEQLYAGDGGE